MSGKFHIEKRWIQQGSQAKHKAREMVKQKDVKGTRPEAVPSGSVRLSMAYIYGRQTVHDNWPTDAAGAVARFAPIFPFIYRSENYSRGWRKVRREKQKEKPHGEETVYEATRLPAQQL